MDYKIFLDDIRMPTDIYPKTDNKDWVIVRDVDEFKKTIKEKGIPYFISFDNDLGAFKDGTSKPEGKDAAKWMTYEEGMDISNMDFKAHSSNIAGPREDIAGWINNWKKQLKSNKENDQKIRKEVRQILTKIVLKEQEIVKIKFNIPIPDDVIQIKNLLKEKGHKLYVVGGAVRDAYLGKQPKDYDLATDALPNTVQEALKLHYKTLETGKAFGIINVLTPSGEYEVATFRKDVGSGRRPDSVEFTTIDQDVKRRDLTINALFYDIDTSEIVDLIGGLEDLRNGIVRTVGSAEDRFSEDRLRIMRVIRFAGRFGSELDPKVDQALRKDSRMGGFPEIKVGDNVTASGNVSGERIRDEFLKGIKSAKSVVHFLDLLEKYNIFQWIFGKLNYKTDFIEEKDIPVLIAYLLQNNNIDSVKLELNKLKYSTDEISQIYFLLNFKKISPENAFRLKKMQINSKLSDEQIKKFAHWNNIDSKLVNAFMKFNLSVSGQELMNQGFKGKFLGDEIEKREIENFKELL